MISKIPLVMCFMAAFVLAGLGQTPCTRYVQPHFSMCQPTGWTLDAADTSEFKTITGKSVGGKNANVNFSEDDNSLSLSDYVAATNKYTLGHVEETGLTSIQLRSTSAVVTDSNAKGFKTTFLEELKGTKLFSAQYIFEVGKKKLLVTFTSVDTEIDSNEKLFDATVKTLIIVPYVA